VDIIAPLTKGFLPARIDVGLGGNEATLVSWWRALRARRVRARVFLAGEAADRPDEDWYSLASWGAINHTHPAEVVIAWRDARVLHWATAATVWVLYIGDRVTPGLDLGMVECDLAFVGSHAAYDRYRHQVTPRYGFVVHSCGHTVNTDLPGDVERRRWQCVHASAPYRGLGPLLDLWPRIRRQAPRATLLIMGGYQLWGYDSEHARRMALSEVPQLADLPDGVRHVGAVPRAEYLRNLASSQLMLYPTNYDEMCCITALEAAACGTVPVVSDRAALRERVAGGHSGLLICGDVGDQRVRDEFADQAVALLHDPIRLERLGAQSRREAAEHTVGKVINNLLERIDACR
jgi:glycosyltransferase involved in cell wall biosynthesis